MDVALFRRFAPAPDSAVADALRCGKSPWHDAVHLRAVGERLAVAFPVVVEVALIALEDRPRHLL